MSDLMSLENAALLVGAMAALVYAIAKAVGLISEAVSSLLTARADVKRIHAENERLKAESLAKDREAENEQMSKIISILDRQTEQVHRFTSVAEDFATASNRHIETDEKVAAAMREMAAENRALRISMEAWPKTVDSTLADLIRKVETVEAAIQRGNGDHEAIRDILQHKVLAGIQEVISLLKPPPPSPASVPKPEDAKPLDADGAKDSAAVDVDAQPRDEAA